MRGGRGGRGGGRRIPLTNLLPKRALRCNNCGTRFKAAETIRDLEGNLVSQCPACYEQLVVSVRRPRLRLVDSPPPVLMLVDDDEGLRSMLHLFFEPLTSDILEASNCETALEIAAQTPPDVVICDQLLVGDGDEIGNKLRQMLPDCRIVSYSGREIDKPWADETVVKGTRDDLERLRAAVLPDAD